MEFNIQKFLVKNKLTKRSLLENFELEEDDNTGLTLGDDGDDEGFEDEDGTDDWHKPEPDDSAQFEKEPSAKDVKGNEPAVNDIHQMQAELQALVDKKDALLMQLNSNIITTNQYKQIIQSAEVGDEKAVNIPVRIKKLRADIEKAMNVSVDDEDSEL